MIDDEAREPLLANALLSLPSRVEEPTFLQDVIAKFGGEVNDPGRGATGLGSVVDVGTGESVITSKN